MDDKVLRELKEINRKLEKLLKLLSRSEQDRWQLNLRQNLQSLSGGMLSEAVEEGSNC